MGVKEINDAGVYMEFLKTRKSKAAITSLDNCSARLLSNLIMEGKYYYGW